MFKFTTQTKNELWWLIISVDYHYSRIAIADHKLTNDHLILWLEDKQDYKNTLEECLQLTIPTRAFARFIKEEQLNSYETMLMHPNKQFVYPARVEISKPLTWYQHDATITEQRWAREDLVKRILTHLIESESFTAYNYAK